MIISKEVVDLIFKVFVYASLFSLLIYIPRICYYFEGFKKPKKLNNPEKNKLAVLVPSRNEKGVVHLLDSLAEQTYDSKYFDTYVIFAEKDDPAIELCKNYKNTYAKIVENQTCKGDALDGAIQAIRKGKKKYAGYIIVDADNVVDKDFVLEMNNALMSKRDIILGKRCVKNYLFERKYHNWVVNCNGLIYTFLDKLGNCFRTKYSMQASICGTGIMVTEKVIEDLKGWPFRSVTEDYEFAISSLLYDRTIFYYEPAVTYTEETMSHKSANDRRKRWILGYAQVNKTYRAKIVDKYHADKKKLKDKSLSKEEKFYIRGNAWGCFDFAYSFFPLGTFFGPAVLASLIYIVCAIASLINAKGFSPELNYMLIKLAIIIGVMYGVLAIYTIIGLLADRKAIKISFLEKLFVVLINPIFTAEYAYFFARGFYQVASGKCDTAWVVIDRLEGLEKN